MHKLYQSILILFSLYSCNNDIQKKDIDTLTDFNGKSHLKFFVSNCKDTCIFQIQTRTVIPWNIENKQLVVPRNGIYELTVNSTHPFLDLFFCQNKRYPLFTVPNDTLKVYIDLDFSKNLRNSIKYEGKTGLINDYYIEKFSRFTYLDIAVPATNYTSPSFSINDGARKIDSLFNEEKKFFLNYAEKSDLPQWFKEMEKMDLYYHNANFKLGAIYSRNLLNGENTKATDAYFDFLDSIPINNPKAYLSSHYFEFLMSYFYRLNMDKYEFNKTGFNRAYSILKINLPIILERLSDETQKHYLAYSFSKYKFQTKNAGQSQKLDSLFETVSNNINDSIIINAVKNNRKLQFETLGKNSILNLGEIAPDFLLSDLNGKFHTLKEFQGKLIYISFWATWCSSCLKSIPQKNSIIGEYANKPIEFINISFDNEKDKWEKSIKNNSISGLNLICNGNWEDILKTSYNIQGIPRYVLINKDGKIIDSDAPSPDHMNELVSLIDKYLNLEKIQ
jgi:thiol-disulfide isomerase/thioredoxin